MTLTNNYYSTGGICILCNCRIRGKNAEEEQCKCEEKIKLIGPILQPRLKL